MVVVSMTGRVSKDLEVKISPNKKDYINFSLAIDKGFGDNKKTMWLNCSLYGESANRMVKAGVKKGSLIQIVGDLDIYDYEKNDGTKAMGNRTLILNWSYAPAPSKKKEGDNDNNAGSEDTNYAPEATQCNDDDLPF